MLKSREDKFWRQVNKRGAYPHKKACKVHPEIKGTRCWEWIGNRNPAGYGKKYYGKEQQAHRVSFILANEKIKKGCGVRHKCDNPPCVRPLHLFQGTDREDTNDKIAKGRQSKGKKHSRVLKGTHIFQMQGGEINSNAKVTNKQAIKIRKMYATKGYTYKYLATLFKLSAHSIFRIVKRKTFKNVK